METIWSLQNGSKQVREDLLSPTPRNFIELWFEKGKSMEVIFVGDLSYFCARQDLLDLFSPFGPVSSAVVRKSKSNEPLHYGFVEMPVECAKQAIETLNGTYFLGRKLRLSVDKIKNVDYHQYLVSIHVSFLSQMTNFQVDEIYLAQVFAKFGDLVDCVVKQHSIAQDPPKQCGYGFLYFSDMESAQNVLNSLQSDPTLHGVKYDCKLSNMAPFIEKEQNRQQQRVNAQLPRGQVMQAQGKQVQDPRFSPSPVAITSSDVDSRHGHFFRTQSSQYQHQHHQQPQPAPYPQYSAGYHPTYIGVPSPHHIPVYHQQIPSPSHSISPHQLQYVAMRGAPPLSSQPAYGLFGPSGQKVPVSSHHGGLNPSSSMPPPLHTPAPGAIAVSSSSSGSPTLTYSPPHHHHQQQQQHQVLYSIQHSPHSASLSGPSNATYHQLPHSQQPAFTSLPMHHQTMPPLPSHMAGHLSNGHMLMDYATMYNGGYNHMSHHPGGNGGHQHPSNESNRSER